MEFSTLKQLVAILIAIAIVVAAGSVVGQAPELFGAEPQDDPEASIEFSDQTGDGASVTVDNATLSTGGFVVVTGQEGRIVGVSEYLEPGSHENVTVEGRDDEDVEMRGLLTATAHRDTNDDESFDFEETDGEDDPPYIEDGYPVSDTATVSLSERPDGDGSSNSFRVESMAAPERATANDTIEVATEIRNPNEYETRQPVELRLDGEVLERRVISLEGEETRDLTFEANLTGVEPGSHTIGVYTTDDGALQEVQIDYDGAPELAVVDADNASVVANATLPAGGFLAVENADGETIGTSERLDPGEHENVTVVLESEVEDGETLTVVAYEGDPDDVENATAYEEDGERIEATASVGEPETDG